MANRTIYGTCGTCDRRHKVETGRGNNKHTPAMEKHTRRTKAGRETCPGGGKAPKTGTITLPK